MFCYLDVRVKEFGEGATVYTVSISSKSTSERLSSVQNYRRAYVSWVFYKTIRFGAGTECDGYFRL